MVVRQCLSHFGFEVARGDTIDLNVVARQLYAHATREHFHRPFGSGIGGDGVAAKFALHRANIDDFTALTLHHMAGYGL
ncbi:hypothetical protein D3C72_1741370 [compost metagenome]